MSSPAAPGNEIAPAGSDRAVVRLVGISEQPLVADQHEAAVDHPRAGAQAVFCGIVRDHDHGRSVVELEYQGHPSAGSVLVEIAERIAAEPGVLGLAVSHRVGTLAVGDIALVAAVATAHRAQAFEVCARLVEEVKSALPIWKRQIFADGSDEWVNCP
jgi:molybdopterin synthase catalytic subunit